MNDKQKNNDKEEVVEDPEEIAKAASAVSSGEPKEDKKIKKGSSKDEEVEELRKKVADLEDQSRLNRDQLLRSVADYRNLEKRFDDEKREFVKYANRELLLRLLPSFDTLFLAEKYVQDEGIKLTIKHLQESLKDVGVERVVTDGKKFDVQVMEAVTTGDGEDGMVIEELRPGFTINGKLVRPAQVKVGKSV